MARVKTEDMPGYMKADSDFWKTPGLSVTPKTESFKAGVSGSDQKFDLTATYSEVSFGGNLDVAVKALGGIPAVLETLEDAINNALVIQAKNKSKTDSLGFERKVGDSVNAAIAEFTKVRGTTPTNEQVSKIRAKVRARLEELERLAKETVDFAEV